MYPTLPLTPTHLASHVHDDGEGDGLAGVAAEVSEKSAVDHELGDDPDGFLARAHRQQLHQLLVAQAVHDVRLPQERLCRHRPRLERLDGHVDDIAEFACNKNMMMMPMLFLLLFSLLRSIYF